MFSFILEEISNGGFQRRQLLDRDFRKPRLSFSKWRRSEVSQIALRKPITKRYFWTSLPPEVLYESSWKHISRRFLQEYFWKVLFFNGTELRNIRKIIPKRFAMLFAEWQTNMCTLVVETVVPETYFGSSQTWFFAISTQRRSFALLCARLRSFALVCARLRPFAQMRLRSFALFLLPTAFRATTFGRFR